MHVAKLWHLALLPLCSAYRLTPMDLTPEPSNMAQRPRRKQRPQRPRAVGVPTFAIGETVEVYNIDQQMWVAADVIRLLPDGGVHVEYTDWEIDESITSEHLNSWNIRKAPLFGRWFYRHNGKQKFFDINNADGRIIFTEGTVTGQLTQGPYWLKGDLYNKGQFAGRIRLRSESYYIRSNIKLAGEDMWLKDVIAYQAVKDPTFAIHEKVEVYLSSQLIWVAAEVIGLLRDGGVYVRYKDEQDEPIPREYLDSIIRKASGILPECKYVYDALLVHDIGEIDAAWPKELVPKAELLQFLDAIDQPENPLFENASPFERSMWFVKGSAGSPSIPGLVEKVFTKPRNVMVVGDLHGRLGSLRRIHKKWLDDGMPYVVGLGDMVDRGNRQVEVAAAFLAWRCQYPDKVMVLHGNHENSETNSRYGLACVEARGPYAHTGVFWKLNSIFAKIPTALVARQPPGYEDASGVFMHGGFGIKSFDASLNHSLSDDDIRDALYEMQWNEKGDHACSLHDPSSWFRTSKRGETVFEFCKLLSFHFLKNLHACALFTGHTHINRLNSEALAQMQGEVDMDDPGTVAHLGGCTKMSHFVTLSAHRFFQECSAERTLRDHNCQGKVTVVKILDSKVEISQENLFDCQGRDPSISATNEPPAASKAEKVLDVGVGGGRYPDTRKQCAVQPTWYLDTVTPRSRL